MTTRLRSLLFPPALALALAFTGVAAASDKVPETPADHEAAASEFKKKAEGHRAEAEMHRKMAEMYAARIKPEEKAKSAKPNPWLRKMIMHCKGIAAKADALAKAEEQAAEVHSAQAKAPGSPDAPK